MRKIAPDQKWLKKVPSSLQPLMAELQGVAFEIMDDETPYHSVRIAQEHLNNAGGQGGRVIGWAISAITDQGWEYENMTCDNAGTMWLMFKNPYVFS